MTARQVASLALKLIGICLLLRFIALSQYVVMFMDTQSVSDSLNLKDLLMFGSYAVIAGVYILICGLMIARSDRLAEAMVDDDHDLALAPGLKTQDIQAIAFSCIGVVLLVNAAMMVPNIVAFFTLRLSSGSSHYISSIVRFIFQVAIGLVLFFQGPGLARFWHRLRG